MSNYVFNAYLYDAMTGTVKGKDYYRANMFDVWLCPSGIKLYSEQNKKNLRFSDDLFNDFGINISYKFRSLEI